MQGDERYREKQEQEVEKALVTGDVEQGGPVEDLSRGNNGLANPKTVRIQEGIVYRLFYVFIKYLIAKNRLCLKMNKKHLNKLWQSSKWNSDYIDLIFIGRR